MSNAFLVQTFEMVGGSVVAYRFESYMPEESLAKFCRKYYIRKLSLFGSMQRDEMHPKSDIDLLVEFEPGHVPGLITLAGIEIELTKMFGKKIDLRTSGDLSRYFRDHVVNTAEVQYEAR